MIEYGLSVSLDGSPRTPRTPRTPDCPRSSSFTPTTTTNGGGAPRKIMKFADICLNDGGGGGGSVSPRILFPHPVTNNNVRRRLDISFSRLMEEDGELSPVSFTASASASASGTLSVCSVGDCGVCYTKLPLLANHIFTICGHLYCVRCLLKWWDTSSTCPLCRAELYEPDADDAEGGADDAEASL
jgi:hypothetical protein